MSLHEHEKLKRASRITAAKLAVKLGERYNARYPASTAAQVVRDLRLALTDLIVELEREPATGETR